MVSYFKDWMNENGRIHQKILADLHEEYQRADGYYSLRFDSFEDATVINRQQDFETILKKIGEIELALSEFKKKNKEKNNPYLTYKKMLHLTKGNVLLRYGQYMGEHFYDPSEYYHQACIILKQIYDPDSDDFLDLMLQLNLGKYFRNLGKHNQRNDYWRALDEFEEVEKKIKAKTEGRSIGENELWKIHIWLETRMNIGRAHRYLYHIQKAKSCFLEITKGILTEWNKKIPINSALDSFLDKENIRTDINLDAHTDREQIYKEYLIQALVQLAIVYQKSRDYDMSLDICKAILNYDPNNVDAKNSKGVCLWKQHRDFKNGAFENVEETQATEAHFDDNLTEYEQIFNSLASNGNRFAGLYKIKCAIQKNSPTEKIQKSINELLNRNPSDREVRLLLGLFLQKQGKYKKSTSVLEKLYEESPHISKGTIGLKAYYNIAQNLFLQEDYHNAKKYYEKIQEECGSDSYPQQKERLQSKLFADTNMHLDSFMIENLRLDAPPIGDLLADIGQGICLMKLGYYKKSKDRYEMILEKYGGMQKRLGEKNKAKIKKYLAICYLHLARDPKQGRTYLQKAEHILNSIQNTEPSNYTMNLHQGYYFYELMQQTVLGWKPKLEKALEYFEKAETFPDNYHKKDVYINTGWVSASVFPLLNAKQLRLENSERKKYLQNIENRLRYSSGTYSIKACANLAYAIKMMETEYNIEQIRLETMYRSLARLQLYENEEGYKLFQRLQKNNTFRKLTAAKRGELLMCLFRLYKQIIDIKDICKFVPGAQTSGAGNLIPVHYTKISTLKRLLPEDSDTPGKLRLWNTIYMNDSFEGECFIEMMEKAALRLEFNSQQLENTPEQQRNILEKIERYFPHPNKKCIDEDTLTPINENIYVTSFTKLDNAIPMWVSYADDAKGCSITFTEDFLDTQKAEDTLTDVSIYSDQDYPLYVIQYIDRDSDENIQIILKIMEEIWCILDDLEKRMEETPNNTKWDTHIAGLDEKGIIRNFVTSCLNEVRFLFKSSEYSHEKEVRMIHHCFEPKIDLDNFDVPRLYVEVDKDIQIEKVQLGPKIEASQANEIVTWLTNTQKVAHITKSGRHYK